MIPTAAECFRIMKRYGMLDNIRAHSVIVEKVAGVIAKGLIRAGEDISLEKVIAGALMHDIGKTSCLGTSYDHSKKGMEICVANSLNEIADIVSEHVIIKGYDLDGDITEKEIVYYSDKRVNHDRVVSLEKRIEYIIDRYSGGKAEICARIEDNFKICKQVEEKIFSRLDFEPEDLKGLIK